MSTRTVPDDIRYSRKNGNDARANGGSAVNNESISNEAEDNYNGGEIRAQRQENGRGFRRIIAWFSDKAESEGKQGMTPQEQEEALQKAMEELYGTNT